MPKEIKPEAKLINEKNEIIKLKKALQENGINYKNIAFVPAMPILTGIEKEFMIEEYCGIKIFRLISSSDD